jgi:hypothetical protein
MMTFIKKLDIIRVGYNFIENFTGGKIMNPIVAAASVISAGLSVGLAAIGPGIGQVLLQVMLLKVRTST